ncbi:MAG: FHA domain-containing protein, partial [Ktedonobacteraceae bacterium]
HCPAQSETPRNILTTSQPLLYTLSELTSTANEQQSSVEQRQTSSSEGSVIMPETPLPIEQASLLQDTYQTSIQTTLVGEDTTITQPILERVTHAEESMPAHTPIHKSMDTLAPSSSAGEPGSTHENQPAVNEEALLTQQNTLVPRLLISSPYAKRPTEFLLTKEAINVGRASANDLLLNDDNLTSRYHALFKRVETRVLVFDKHSNNGVFVNGQRIEAEQDCELADGDHISIGSYELIYRAAQPKYIPQLI